MLPIAKQEIVSVKLMLVLGLNPCEFCDGPSYLICLGVYHNSNLFVSQIYLDGFIFGAFQHFDLGTLLRLISA